MLPALLTIADFEQRYGRTLTAEEQPRAEALIDDVSALIRDLTGEDFIDSEGHLVELPGAIVAVAATAVRRAFDNPGALESETMGSYTWRSSAAAFGLYLTDAERSILRRAVGKSSVASLALESVEQFQAGGLL